jgi:hypothetical protein
MGSLNPFKKPKQASVPKMDIAGDINKYVTGYQQALPRVLSSERQYRPEFLGLNLGDVNTFLQGTDGQQGLYGLGRTAQQEAGAGLAEARAAELASMTGQAPAFRQFAQALSPEAQAQVEAAQMEAERARAAAQGVTPQEQRMYQQTAREAAQASGRLGGNAAIASEIMGRENVLARKRAEADAARTGAFNMAQNFYTAPGLQALGSAPLSYQAGQDQLRLGLGAIGSAVPQMINPDTGVNLGMQQRSLQQQASAANASASASKQSGLMGMFGSAAAAAIPLMFSDKRLKTDIKKVGKTNEGLPVYTYKYKGDDTTQMGVMAQDVEKKTPSAVRTLGGFKAVDYTKVK